MASNAEFDRLSYRAACSSTNKLIKKSCAASNVECINEAFKNSRRLWSTIKSLLHSSPPSEQLSPSISQPLAHSLATFFCQKIVALKESISQITRQSLMFFLFWSATQQRITFGLHAPAEVSKLLQPMSNKSSQLDYNHTSLVKSCADTFHPHSLEAVKRCPNAISNQRNIELRIIRVLLMRNIEAGDDMPERGY